ncbi:ROK family protein [Lactobacillus acetotolerans]|uniref:ROK family protein n=1 Tax=Lactobacillus acetotolerans TaxID=1600 RepID=UPI0014519097|nr:ROK family protein [Lactobacillus acetotolerans]QJD72616.1 ROK family protein [Lactobacillus acetotolerans]
MTQYLSFDIGGTNLKYALLNHEGHIIEKNRVNTNTESLTSFMSSIYKIADAYKGKFEGIALCAPGKIDSKNKVIHYGGALTFLDGLDLNETPGKRYNVPVGVENDGKAAALAELWLGELQDVNSGFAMTLGTALGGGILLDGHVLHGKDFQAGEISWMITNISKGSNNLEAYSGYICSAVRMIYMINKAVGNSNLKDGIAAFDAIRSGNKTAVKIFKEFCLNLAAVILNIQVIVNGEKVVIGGGISAQPILIKEVRKQFKHILTDNQMINNQINPPKIVAAKFKNDANLYGALYALLLELNGEKVQ